MPDRVVVFDRVLETNSTPGVHVSGFRTDRELSALARRGRCMKFWREKAGSGIKPGTSYI